jgi:3-phenylpropionate/trans-cinnamate dioxygenase ferredoxin subunit
MADFIKVARVSELASPGKRVIDLDDRLVVLVRIGDQFYCIDDVCTHDGGPLGEGQMTGHSLACPRHGAQFDVRSGKALTMPATVDTVAHEVKVVDGDVYIRLRED